ncbi:MAG: hypothetical protein Q4G70_10580 [Pseudomonadota bacterium]|nr:hypothetical protein [Pseudomonadota bacterium]
MASRGVKSISSVSMPLCFQNDDEMTSLRLDDGGCAAMTPVIDIFKNHNNAGHQKNPLAFLRHCGEGRNPWGVTLTRR